MPPPPSLEAGLHEAMTLVREAQWPRAMAVCAALLRAHGPHPAVLQMVGWLRLEQGDAAGALEALEEALRRRPRHLPTLALAARAAERRGALEVALGHADAAAALAPDDPDAVCRVAALLVATGRPDAARVRLDRLLVTHSEHAGAWYEHGRAWRAIDEAGRRAPVASSTGDGGGIAESTSAPDTAGPETAGPATTAASTPLATARASFARAAALAPGLAPAWFALALCAQDEGDAAAAEQALRQAEALEPTRPEAALNLGIVLQEAGRIDDALAAYGRAYRRSPATFGRIAHALADGARGRLWLDLDVLREELAREP